MKTRTIIALSLAAIASLSSAYAQTQTVEFQSPKLTVTLPPEGLRNGKAVLACPGGGYSMLARGHEGFDWAPFFNDLGFAYAVVEYRMPEGNREIPMEDVRNAYKILVDSASVWGISPDAIGIMGSSAGGHLASTIATHPTTDCQPAFQVLFYPVITLEKELTHKGTRNGFLGTDPDRELVEEFSSQNKVSPTTPPAFITLSTDDDIVPAENSIMYYSALLKAGVPAAMMIYPTGGHGWGYRSSFKHHNEMTEALKAWLNNL